MVGLEKRKLQSKWRVWTSRQKLRLILGVALLMAFVISQNLIPVKRQSIVEFEEDLCADMMKEAALPPEVEGAVVSLPPLFNSSSSLIKMFAWRLDGYLVPWMGILGIAKGLGSSGMIKDYTLQIMGTIPQVMACCSHVIVVGGKVYFRYGGFVTDEEKLTRLHESLRMVQAAIDKYQLIDLKVEFFINTCRWPLSYDNAMSPMTTGRLRTVYPILSTRLHPASTDILIPDPMDTYEVGAENYFPRSEDAVPWDSKEAKAVFRSDNVNFDIVHDFWAVSPRLRLHRMTDARPDLLDARLTNFHAVNSVHPSLLENGLVEGEDLDISKKSRFKYEMVVDGHMAADTVCSVLGSTRAMIRQETEIIQFFDPLLVPGVHYLPTKRYFADLFQVIEWARDHDRAVKEIVSNGNEMADAVCSREGRVDYWALLLLKYQKAMEDPSNIKAPTKFCNHGPHLTPAKVVFPTTCDKDKLEKVKQPACVFFCGQGSLGEETWEWLTFDSLTPLADRTVP